MDSQVTLEFLAPNSDEEVMSSVNIPFTLTDAYKYISTMGHPAAARGGLDVDSSAITANYRATGANVSSLMNPEVCAGGLVCFGTDVSGETFFDHNSQLVGYGTRYSTDMSSLSTKYGAKLIDNTVLEPCHFRQCWEFAASQGNGTIKSIALTHQAGAHAIDSGDFVTDMTPAIGNDFSLLTDAQSEESTAIDGTTMMNYGGTYANIMLDHMRNFYAYNASDSTTAKNTFVYQTENYVFLCRAVSLNVANASSQYVTTFRYKKIAKDDLDCFFEGSTPYPSFSKLSMENSDSDEFYSDGTFEITSNSYLRTVSGSTNSAQGAVLKRYIVQDAAYLAFAAFYAGSSFPSYDDGYNSSYTYATRIYFVEGDTPTVSMQDTVYKSPLGDNAGSNMGLVNILFLKDKSFIAVRAYLATTNYWYFYRARVANSTLIWKLNLPSDGTWSASFLLDNPDYFLLVKRASLSGGAVYEGQIRSISNGSLVGSCLNIARSGALYRAKDWLGTYEGKSGVIRSAMLLSTSKKSPFIIQTRTDESSTRGNNFSALLRTNYLFGYGVLPEPITKTTAFRLRVTVDVYFD